MRVLIIGAGIAGICTAAILAAKGWDVTVIEKNNQPGGRSIVWKEKGFVFDMGPSWYLMPEVFENFIGSLGKKVEEVYKLKRLDPAYKVFFQNSEKIDMPANLKEVKEVFDGFEKDGGIKLERYLDEAEYKYNIAMNKFLYKEYRTLFDFFSPELLINGSKLQVFDSIDAYAKRFFKDSRARKVLEYSMVFLGGSPENTPALYSIMSHVDLKAGVYYPDGGFANMMRGLERLANEKGVKFNYNQEVKKIIVNNGKAVGVETKNKKYQADVVISGADYPHTELELLEPENQTYNEKYWEKSVVAPSAILMYLGFNKKINGLEHHNLFLADEWMEHFDSIFKNPEWPENPSYYVGCPSKSDKTVAPKGHENVFVLVPVAAGLKDSEKVKERYLKWVIKNMEKELGEKIEKNLIVKKIIAQRDFSSLYHAYKGTALGMAHTLMQTAVFRPAHKSKKVKNLYYVGHYTHPGIGLPMAVISSQIVCNEIVKEYE